MARMKMVLVCMAILFNLVASADTTPPATSYVNHTVGGDAGWFFNAATNKPSFDYTAWVAKQTFNLGDYLIFNTNTNQTVIQTYNETTYKNCTADYDLDGETYYYYFGGSKEFGKPMTLQVPLTIEGPQYYFSDGDDGEQCLDGMAFEIKVSRGLGLPPSLNQPPPPAYVPPPASSEDVESPPVATTPPPSGGGTNIVASFITCVVSLLVVWCCI